jgi:hypothetical protein
MNRYGAVEVYLHALLPPALLRGELSASRIGHFTPGTHWIGNCVSPRVGLDSMVRRKICYCQELNPSHPDNSLLTIMPELLQLKKPRVILNVSRKSVTWSTFVLSVTLHRFHVSLQNSSHNGNNSQG